MIAHFPLNLHFPNLISIIFYQAHVPQVSRVCFLSFFSEINTCTNTTILHPVWPNSKWQPNCMKGLIEFVKWAIGTTTKIICPWLKANPDLQHFSSLHWAACRLKAGSDILLINRKMVRQVFFWYLSYHSLIDPVNGKCQRVLTALYSFKQMETLP